MAHEATAAAFPIDDPQPPSPLARNGEWMRWAGRQHRMMREAVPLWPGEKTSRLAGAARLVSADAAHLMGQARALLAEYAGSPALQSYLLCAWHGWREEVI